VSEQQGLPRGNDLIVARREALVDDHVVCLPEGPCGREGSPRAAAPWRHPAVPAVGEAGGLPVAQEGDAHRCGLHEAQLRSRLEACPGSGAS